MKKMKPISSIDDYCRVDTTNYRSGGIKTLSQMAGKRRNGAFVKKMTRARLLTFLHILTEYWRVHSLSLTKRGI